VRTGAGEFLHPDAADPDITGELGRMLADSRYSKAAAALAARDAEVSVGTIMNRTIARIEAIAAQTGEHR
jgi:hypothetical protein